MPYKRGNSWYSDVWVEDPATGKRSRLRQSLGRHIRRKRDAQVAESELVSEWLEQRRAVQRGEPAQVTYLYALAERWLRDEVAVHKKPGTHVLYEASVRVHIKPFFGDVPIQTIRTRDTDAFIAELTRKGLAPNSINSVLTALKGMMTTAVRWELIQRSPCDQMRWMRAERGALVWYDRVQAAAMLAACERVAPEMWRLMFLGFNSGMRPGELLAARQGDLDLVRHRIHVQRTVNRLGKLGSPKGGRSRWVDLPRAAAAQLRATRHLNGDLICPQPSGKMWSSRQLASRWRRCWLAAGLPETTPHAIRHSYASQLVSAGVSLFVVQTLLGHADVRETQRYAHLAPRATRSAVDLLGEVVPQSGHNLDTTDTTGSGSGA